MVPGASSLFLTRCVRSVGVSALSFSQGEARGQHPAAVRRRDPEEINQRARCNLISPLINAGK